MISIVRYLSESENTESRSETVERHLGVKLPKDYTNFINTVGYESKDGNEIYGHTENMNLSKEEADKLLPPPPPYRLIRDYKIINQKEIDEWNEKYSRRR